MPHEPFEFGPDFWPTDDQIDMFILGEISIPERELIEKLLTEEPEFSRVLKDRKLDLECEKQFNRESKNNE